MQAAEAETGDDAVTTKDPAKEPAKEPDGIAGMETFDLEQPQPHGGDLFGVDSAQGAGVADDPQQRRKRNPDWKQSSMNTTMKTCAQSPNHGHGAIKSKRS